jgi:predicted transcriptional regulator
LSKLNDRLDVARAILKELSKGSLRRTALEKRVFKNANVSYGEFDRMFAFLCQDGDVEKCSSEHTGAYRLTERGKVFLAWRAIS